jgi:hypothetical protein
MSRTEKALETFVPECMYDEFCDRLGIPQDQYPYIRDIRADLRKPLVHCAVFSYEVIHLTGIPTMKISIVYKEIMGKREYRFRVGAFWISWGALPW